MNFTTFLKSIHRFNISFPRGASKADDTCRPLFCSLCTSRWLCGINFAIPEPKRPSCSPFRGLSGSKIAISEPAGLQKPPRGINFAIPEPKRPSCSPFRGLSGSKIAISEPAGLQKPPRGINFATSEPKRPS